MADKISKVIIDIISRGGANAAAEINKIFKDAVGNAAAQDKFEQRRVLLRDKLAAQSADKQKRLDQQGEQFAARMAESRRRTEERTAQAIQRVYERAAEKRIAADRKAAQEAERSAARVSAAVANAFSKAGGGLASAGATLTAIATVPLVTLGKVSSQSAIAVGDLNNRLISATGSIEGANKELAEFRKLSADSVGVLINFAAETYSFLKPMQIGEKTIDNFTKALGRIKLTDSGLDSQEFSRNMAQMFSQNFEMQDLKQLVGRFPRAAELIAKQFGFKASDLGTIQEGLQGMKKAGKLTLESFLDGFAEAVESDPALGKLTETLGSRLAKASERLNLALAPVGNAILNVVVPALEAASPYLEAFFNWFSKLSPTIQTVVVAVGGFVSVLGPVLIVAAGVAGTIGSIVTGLVALGAGAGIMAGLVVVAKAVGIAILAIIAAFAQLTIPLTAAATLAFTLYKAWETNFGGIRDFTLSAWEAIKSAVSSAMTFIYGVVQSVGGSLVAWWRENYPLIERTVADVSVRIRTTVQTFLNAIQSFWDAHGKRITAFVKSTWDLVSTTIGAVMTQIGNVIRLALQIYNRDWDGAWKTMLKALQEISGAITRNVRQLIDMIGKAVFALMPILVSAGQRFMGWAVSLGQRLMTYFVDLTGRIVAGIVDIIFNLPQRLLEIVPKLYKTGKDLISALRQGIADALAEGSRLKLGAEFVDGMTGAGMFGGKTPYSVNSSGLMTGGSVQGAVAPQAAGSVESDKRRKERESLEKRELDAQTQLLKNQLEEVRKEYGETLNKLRDKLKETGNVDEFNTGIVEAARAFGAELSSILPMLEKVEEKQANNEKKIASELKLLADDQQRRREDILAETRKQIDENGKAVEDAEKKQSDETVKNAENTSKRVLAVSKAETEQQIALQERLYKNSLAGGQTDAARDAAVQIFALRRSLIQQEIGELEKLQKKQIEGSEEAMELANQIAVLKEQQKNTDLETMDEFEKRLTEIGDRAFEIYKRLQEEQQKLKIGLEGGMAAPAPESGEADAGGGTGWFESIFGSLDFGIEKLTSFGQVVRSIGSMVSDVFMQMGQAVGDMIGQWVLMGDESGASMKKMLASVLSGVAAQAATLAIFHTAMGLAALTPWGALVYGAAPLHFAAAGTWAGIAVGSALIGRAVAGDSFKNKKQSSSFGAAAGNATGSNSSNNSTGSANDISTINIGRNAPSRPNLNEPLHIKLSLNSNGVLDVLEENSGRNGRARKWVLDVVEA